MALPAIHLKDIPDDGLTLDAPLDASWLAHVLEDSGCLPVAAKKGRAVLRLDKHGRDVTVTGTVDVPVQTSCVRCLAPVELQVHSEFALHLEPKPAQNPHTPHEEIELKAGELDADYYEGDTIELDQWVREQVLLEVPPHPICPEACKQPIAAPPIERDRNYVDPRLAPLKQFLKR